ncbi:MAG: PHP domain-containing protein, partial [bacterium]
NSKTVVTLEPKFSSWHLPEGEYKVTHYSVNYPSKNEYQSISLKRDGNKFHIEGFFEGEQEHIIYIEVGSRTFSFSLYSVEEDLLYRTPYKGDMHIHTYYSDGIESPAYVASSSRKIGLDFLSITDHRRYFPSIEAIETFKGLDLSFKIFPGEEVHPPNNPLHIVNFGGSFSINELFDKEREGYDREVSEIEEKLKKEIPDIPERSQLASSIWCFDKIREGGGLGVFAHPFWRVKEGYYISERLFNLLYDKEPFDAVEIVGGYHMHELVSNNLQIVSYYERSRGKSIPVVGVTDAHGCETGSLFGWYYTVVFSPTLELKDIIESIRLGYSVGVEAIPQREPRVYGSLRLVLFTQFLIREIFPTHDKICEEEGKFMIRYITGKADNKEPGFYKRDLEEFYKLYWQR